VKLKKADTTAIRPVEIGHRKAKQLEKERKNNRHKPY
jgi:RNA-binding protein 42